MTTMFHRNKVPKILADKKRTFICFQMFDLNLLIFSKLQTSNIEMNSKINFKIYVIQKYCYCSINTIVDDSKFLQLLDECFNSQSLLIVSCT